MEIHADCITDRPTHLDRPPMLVIATDNLRTLRFFSANQVPPFHIPTSNLIAAQEFWSSLNAWSSPLAPGGAL
jgi:hypothetical protein